MAGKRSTWRGEVEKGPEMGVSGKGADDRPRSIARFRLKEVRQNGMTGYPDFEARGEQANRCKELLKPGVYCEVTAVEYYRQYWRKRGNTGDFTRRAVEQIRVLERPTWLDEVEAQQRRLGSPRTI